MLRATPKKLFGTDGIRGKANVFPMTADLIQRVAMVTGLKFFRGSHRHLALIAKDTRQSGYMIEGALAAGLMSVGMDVAFLGPIPTPALSILTKSMRADLGLMISASHNPYEDNGIKIFGPDGYKLNDDLELDIESCVLDLSFQPSRDQHEIGIARRFHDAQGRYIEFLKATLDKKFHLNGKTISIDCANGAGYRVAPQILWEFGADVDAHFVHPDGKNINEGCGAVYPQFLSQQVQSKGSFLGIALDGDADRLILVDEKGNVLNGDVIIALIATFWKQCGRSMDRPVILTQMSNLGLEHYLKSIGFDCIRTAVGDRYVIEAMRAHGAILGGEPSGHIIMSEYATTGDGLMAALHAIEAMEGLGLLPSQVCQLFKPYPQILENIRYHQDCPLDFPDVVGFIHKAEQQLGGQGRVLVRKSGTEPLIRVMVEGENEAMVHTIAREIKIFIETQMNV